MPYYSGSATVSAGPPVSYKMPVPSSSRYSSYRSSSSLERPLYSSSTGSYLTSRSSYTTEYRSKFTSPSRTSSVPSYSRTSSLSDDSGRFTSSSRDRSESRETSSASSASSTTPSSVLGRRYNSASTISPGLSAAELYSKYSPSNYLGDIGRPPAAASTTSSYSRRSGTTTQPTETKASASSSRLSGSRGAVGGCSTATVTPSSERRSRATVNEVILSFNSNANTSSSNNNNNSNTSDSESSSSSGDEDDEGRNKADNNDDNGNKEPQKTVAERRRRFDGSGNGGVDGSSNSTALHTTSSGRQHGGGSRRRREDTLPRATPSPVLVRKVYNNTGALSSDDDEEEEEEEASKKSDESGEEESSEDEEVSKDMSATRRTRAGVAGGASASTDSSNTSIAGASRYSRSQATSQLSPKTRTRQYATESSIFNASPRISSRLNSRCYSNERAGLTGLRNIGNTCFMNSVIQCLSNTRPLLEYVLADSFLADINTSSSSMKGALFKAFATVIQELWRNESDGTIVNTTSLKSQIQRFAPRFMGYSQQDAQEFLRYLLEGLHEDVNRVTSKPKPILTEIDDSLSDQQKAVESWKRYLRMDDSKVVDIFVGQLKSTLRCTVCGHCSVTFDPFWDLSLPIPSRTGQMRLQQCLDHFTREEVMDGDEKPTCSKCQMRRKCTKSFTIQKFPKILVLHLKRFSPMERFRGKLNVTVDFPLSGLDLSAYAASRGQGSMYNLYGVANHSGTTYSGHYTAYCRHPYSGEWHEYNDSRVSSISSRSVVSSEAYVLFYELSGHSSHL